MFNKLRKQQLSKDDNKSYKDDKLTFGYDTILKESAVLTTFAGILFGFLLNMSVNVPKNFLYQDRIIIIVSLSSITIAVLLFIMPVIYHHLEYPYIDISKFKKRSHRFFLFGLIPTGITLYLGLELAISSITGFAQSFILASLPFILVYFLFRARKYKSHE